MAGTNNKGFIRTKRQLHIRINNEKMGIIKVTTYYREDQTEGTHPFFIRNINRQVILPLEEEEES